MKRMDVTQIKELLDQPKKVVITTHYKPDGDAMGASLGMYDFLVQKGHEVKVVVPSEYPDFLHWLPGNREVVDYSKAIPQAIAAIEQAELLIALDYNSPDRAGGLGIYIEQSKATKLMIDHHLDPQDFVDFAISDPQASSTAEMVYEFIKELGEGDKINEKIANCLYTGIVTDTGQFKHSNTSAKVHRITAELMERGANISHVHSAVYDCFTEDRLKLLGYCINERMIVLPEYKTAYIYLETKDFQRFNYKVGDNEGIVNYPLMLKDVVFTVLISENDGIVKMSFRSKGDFPANEVASKHFNGGGHRNAAGGRSKLSLQATIDKFKSILPEFKEKLLV